MKIEKEFNYLKIDNKYYEVEGKEGAPIFKKIETKEVKEKVAKAKRMAKKLKKGFDSEKVLVEVLMGLENEKDFAKLYAMLFKSKKKYKPITRKHRCVDMKIGNFILPITG